MKQKELQQLVKANQIYYVTFFRPRLLSGDQPQGWEVWAYDFEGCITCASFGNKLETSTGEAKLYTSLDRAFKAIRALGYSGKFEIDG